MRPPCDIQPNETIGRRVSSESDARTCAAQSAKQASLPLRVFRHNGRHKVSTDRLREDYYLSVKVIAQEYDDRRGRRFFRMGCRHAGNHRLGWTPSHRIVSMRQSFHADIVLPKSVLKSSQRYDDAIFGLAAEAWWQDVNEEYASPPLGNILHRWQS